MQKDSFINKIIGIVGLIISVILIINFSNLVIILVDFIEIYLSPDNYIKPNTVIELEVLVIFFTMISTTISVVLILHSTNSGVIFILNLKRKINLFLNTYFQTNQAKKLF